VLLKMMYQEYSCNASLTYKFVDLLLFLDESKANLFKKIIENTKEQNISSVYISIFSLYSPLGNFSGVQKEDVEHLLKIIIKCFQINQDNNYFKKIITQFLFPIIQEGEFKSYCTQFDLQL
jgi:hypothetical protein